MDSIYGEDPSLPINFEESGKFRTLPNDTTIPDVSAVNFSQHFGDTSAVGGPTMSSGSGRISPSRAHTMKDLEQQISELKKENFSLKLRIYYMEEKIQQKFEDDDNIKTNIELKVEAESLKKEVMEKQQLLLKASQALESLAQEKEQLLSKQEKERDVSLKQLQEKYDEKLKNMEEENKALREANEDLQNQLEKAQELQQDLEKAVRDKTSEKETMADNNKDAMTEKDRVIDQLQDALKTKEDLISNLTKEKFQIAEGTIQPLRLDKDRLQKELQEKNREIEDLKKDLQNELVKEGQKAEEQLQRQNAANVHSMKQLQDALEEAQKELEAKDNDIKDLENDLKAAQRGEREAGEELKQKEDEIKTMEGDTLKRDKAIQGLVQAVRGKEREIEQLYNQLDEKAKEVAQAREAMHKAELKKYEDLEQYQSSVSDIQSNVADLKADLHSKQLENERLQKANARKQQELDRLRNEKMQAEEETEKALREKDGDIQDLQNQVQEARNRATHETNDVKNHYEDLLEDCKRDLDKKDKVIQKLTKTLQDKDDIIQELMDNARTSFSSHGQRADSDDALQDLKNRLKEREKKLEGKVEEQILAKEAVQDEMANLRRLLKDKENELEQVQTANLEQRQKCKDLENKLKNAGDKNKQLTEAMNIQNRSKEVKDEGLKRSLAEKDAIISNLQKSAAEKDGMIENLRDLLEGQAKGESAKEDLFKQLTTKLKDKEKQLQEMVAERAQVAKDSEKATGTLLDALRDKDEKIKDLEEALNKQDALHNNKLRALQRELDNKELELQGAGDALNRAEKDQENLVGKLRKALEEKDKTIEKLLDSGREKDKLFVEMQQAVAKSHPSSLQSAEIKQLKEEIDGLQDALTAKEDEVRRLKVSLPEKGELDQLRSELENKDKLLERAKATIDQLQQSDRPSTYDMARQKRRISELEAELEAKEEEAEALKEEEKAKDKLIKDLKIRINLADSRSSKEHSPGDLQDTLREQIRELSRLTDALKAERQLYVNITQSGSKDETDSGRARLLESELAAIQALRRQLEQGVMGREGIHINLEGRPYFSTTTSGVGSDMHEASHGTSSHGRGLRVQDLQSKQMQTNKRDDGSSMVSEPLATREYRNIMDMSVPEMQEELIDLRNQLTDATNREMALEEQLGEREEGLRSIPGQEDDSGLYSSAALKQKADSLETQLQKSQKEVESMRQQLEATLLNRSQDGAESNSHVIPILKQQLDQAKTLLREKDSKLQEMEQENKKMKQKLRGSRESSDLESALQEENQRLGQSQKELAAKLHRSADQIKALHDQNENLKEVNEGLSKTIDEFNQNAPHLQSQLERAKSIIRKKERENVALREMLGIGPKDAYDSGNTKVDHLEAANAILKEQLQDKTYEADNLRSSLDSAEKQLSDLISHRQDRPSAETENLRKKLKTAEQMNGLLKRHIALNTPSDGAAGEFNPELIIDLAREIERLQAELRKAGIEPRPGSGTNTKETQTKEVRISRDVLAALEEQLAHCQKELKESTQKNISLQRKIRATEGTVHLQANRIQRYRRQLHNNGLSPASTPKRVKSDSNLFKSMTFSQQFPASRSEAGSESFLASEDSLDNSYAEFGETDDVLELREQVEILKNQNQRCRRAMRMLRGQNNSESNSRSPSPSRSLSPERDRSAWFQVVANQGAFARMQEEVENLKAQLEKANDLNCTLQEQYKDIQAQIEEAQTLPENPDKAKLKAKEKEITLLRGYLDESKRLCDLMKQMLLEALSTMEDIKAARDWLEGNLGESVVEQFELARERLKRGTDLADTLHKALDETSSSTSSRASSKKKSTFAESLKSNLREIASLQKELEQSKKTNQKLRKLLGDNQQVADETRKELEKLTTDVSDKQRSISKLQHQLKEALKANAALEKQKEQKSRKSLQSTSVQTDFLDSTTAHHDVPDLSQLHTKLRENQLLVCTLKSELDLYRNVLHSKTPEGSPHSMKSSQSVKQGMTDDTLKDYLEELRSLRKKLEDSIRVNDRLRKQLEEKMKNSGQDKEGLTIIHLQETNIQLTETVKTLNSKLSEKDRTNQKLKDDNKQAQRDLLRLKTENQRLSEQLAETLQLQNSLRFELSVYEQIHPTDSPKDQKSSSQSTFPKVKDSVTGIDLTELLKEMRHLRVQLERSIDTNNALRMRLEELMKDKHWSPSMEYKYSRVSLKQTTKEKTQSRSQSSRLSRRLFANADGQDESDGANNDTSNSEFSPYEDPQFYDMPAGHRSPGQQNGVSSSPPSKGGEYFAVGTLLTYERLKKTLGECRAVLRVLDTLLGDEKNSLPEEKSKSNNLHQLKSLASKASLLVEESNVHLTKFSRERLPSADEVSRLKRQLVAQQNLMKETLSHLSISNRTKESIEEAIVNTLMEHEATLVKAHRNLETKQMNGSPKRHPSRH